MARTEYPDRLDEVATGDKHYPLGLEVENDCSGYTDVSLRCASGEDYDLGTVAAYLEAVRQRFPSASVYLSIRLSVDHGE